MQTGSDAGFAALRVGRSGIEQERFVVSFGRFVIIARHFARVAQPRPPAVEQRLLFYRSRKRDIRVLIARLADIDFTHKIIRRSDAGTAFGSVCDIALKLFERAVIFSEIIFRFSQYFNEAQIVGAHFQSVRRTLLRFRVLPISNERPAQNHIRFDA